MKIAFIGEDNYSLIALQKLHKYTLSSSDHSLEAVITTAPKIAGKSKSPTPSPVESYANTQNIIVLYYSTISDDMINIVNHITKHSIDLAVLASFGHILPAKLIDTFPKGIINLHPSLLPQYRGATPVQHSILLGDKTTGITLFRLTENIDDGKLLDQTEISIKNEDTTRSLSTNLFSLGIDLLEKNLNNHPDGDFDLVDQIITNDIIYTKTFTRDDGYIPINILKSIVSEPTNILQDTQNTLLNLRLSHNPPTSLLDALYDLHRALHPWPGIWSTVNTKKGTKRIILESVKPELKIKLEGKPSPISWKDFSTYYLS